MKLIQPSTALLAERGPSLRSVGKFRTCDTSFTFRMGAGFAGDVNRGHPASIVPKIIDASGVAPLYGQACILDATTGGVRQFAAGDTAVTEAYGVVVRPYPIQQSTTSNNYGAAPYGSVGSPPSLQPVDVLRGGYVMVQLPAGATPLPGGLVYVWCAAASGAHVQGGFESASSGGNTATLATPKWQWNSPPDANSVAELSVSQI